MLSRHDAKISNLPYYMGDCLPSSTEIRTLLTAETSLVGWFKKAKDKSKWFILCQIGAELARLHLSSRFQTNRPHVFSPKERFGRLT